ncbi:hypothetical protein C8034_v005026 [Colletotrichum sidae]|uniref:Uncharacterized protein n=1 Tax=Colletotrichum sidae TaxID=1347389 RepID=A0A4R8RPX7_9PEZI|nr:hypothetical protein C8034_v005026 [Colletotrichum sidae]
MNINLIKTIDNYKNYSYFYKNLNKLVIYKGNFTILSSFLKVIITKFSFEILLVDKVISITKKYKIERIKKNLILKGRVFSNNSKYFEYILEVAYWILFYSKKVYILKSTYNSY